MLYKFHSYDLGLRVFKDGSIVAIFVNGKFETENKLLAEYLITIEQISCLTPFVPDIPIQEGEEPPNTPKVETVKTVTTRKKKV